MMIDKTKIGIQLFDEMFGGVYRGRTVFCHGRRGSGKSIIAAHFLNQAFGDGDRSLMLTDWQANDVMIVAEAVGVPFSQMVRDGNLMLLEYSNLVPGEDLRADSPLPHTAFVELQRIIASRSIRRVVFDTVLPWLAIHPIEHMPSNVYSFVHALERLNVTSLITLPSPISTPAFVLKNRLEDVCPVVLSAQRAEGTGEASFKVVKYLGNNLPLSSSGSVVFKLDPGRKAQKIERSEPSKPLPDYRKGPVPLVIPPRPTPPPPPPPISIASAVPPVAGSKEPGHSGDDKPITFSSVIDL